MYLLREFEQSFNCLHHLENIFHSIFVSKCQDFNIYGRQVYVAIFFMDLQCQKKSHGQVAAKSDFSEFLRVIYLFTRSRIVGSPAVFCVYSFVMPSHFTGQLNPSNIRKLCHFLSYALQIAQWSRLNLDPARLLPPTMRSR